MASGLFDSAREAYLAGVRDWDADTVRALLIDAGDWTPTFATDDRFDDITPDAAKIGNSGNTGRADGVSLAAKTTTAGVADANDGTITAVTGDQAEAVLVYHDDGATDAGSYLLAYIDSGTGLPVTPNGGDITFQWDSGANKIFAL